MKVNQSDRSRVLSPILALMLCAAALLIGSLALFLGADFAEDAAAAVAVVTLTAFAGLTWQQSHTQARRRQAALDAYAEREIARAPVEGIPAADLR